MFTLLSYNPVYCVYNNYAICRLIPPNKCKHFWHFKNITLFAWPAQHSNNDNQWCKFGGGAACLTDQLQMRKETCLKTVIFTLVAQIICTCLFQMGALCS